MHTDSAAYQCIPVLVAALSGKFTGRLRARMRARRYGRTAPKEQHSGDVYTSSLPLHTCVMVQCKSTHSESAQPVITSNLTQGPGRSAKQPGRVKTDGLRANKKVGEGGSSVVVVINQANILFFTTTRVEEARSDVTEVRGNRGIPCILPWQQARLRPKPLHRQSL